MSAGPVNLLNPDLGIQSIMDTSKADRLPDARPLASSPLREAGLEELYEGRHLDQAVGALLLPSVGDGSILQPDVFHAELRGSLEALRENRNPAVRAFVRDDLAPLMDNTDLLKAYTSLMVGG
ncbi:MAG TPA: type III secretion protein [Candidatus Avidesulfovibrio excrementigallinarum]|nr:type III secretion protein [Candidatus Avidesulfovibrio excrementigallinarum]